MFDCPKVRGRGADLLSVNLVALLCTSYVMNSFLVDQSDQSETVFPFCKARNFECVIMQCLLQDPHVDLIN